ncbi:golgin subfamily A member 4-like [Stegodyphus dumicola]|uniref:golgin subfamily A member 4-like n=1 Tax=Stegodyphus dumicola TaxID=202533 RepID=UPI0015B2C712|nr:golgin subfamily A member 4-like [Stegodyphus dumicola]
MFRRLRERIAEEATKFPVGQLGNTPGKLLPDSENKSATANSSEDLITLSDSSSVVVPHTSTQQFSIGEDEDGSLSEQSTPQKKNDSTGGSDSFYSPGSPKDAHSGAVSDVNFCQEYRPTKSWYIPQSDIESEREEIPTLNLDGISKDRLLAEIQSLKAKAYKYKNKYAEVVKNFKELRDEKTKIENLLIENQDKGLRRIAELREQCQLEQKAKAHLEANLRLLLEEKDSRISVLETQINLLKEGENCSGSKSLPDVDNSNLHEDVSNNVQREENSTPVPQDSPALQEKIERLEHQHKQAKKTITAQTDQITLLRKQNESLSKELEEKVKKLNELEDEQLKMKSEHEFILKNMQIRLEELEKQQEESIMSMAETKKNMHEELELKEKQLIKAEEEARQYQAAAELEKAKISELQKQHEEKINELQHQLESTEKALEEEKQNLMQELNRGKTAAITLMKQENEKKVAAIEEEWKSKLQELQLKSEQSAELKAGDLVKELHEVEERKSIKLPNRKWMSLIPLYLSLSFSLNERKLEDQSICPVFKQGSKFFIRSEIDICCSDIEKLKASLSDYEILKEKGILCKDLETINLELNDKLEIYKQKEINLVEELNVRAVAFHSLEEQNKELINQIEAYKKECDEALKNFQNIEKELKSKLQYLNKELQGLLSDNESKSKEVGYLNKALLDAKNEEKLLHEQLSKSESEIHQLASEKSELISEKKLLVSDIQSLQEKLKTNENNLLFASMIVNDAKNEVILLNDAITEKEKKIDNLLKMFTDLERAVSCLENKENDFKMIVMKLKNICCVILERFNYIFDVFKLLNKEKTSIKFLPVEDSLKLKPDSYATSRREENTVENNLIFEEKSNVNTESVVVSEFIKVLQENSTLSLKELYDLKGIDLNKLQKVFNKLFTENTKLKEDLDNLKMFSETQNVEFAKNITQLHQSLNDLQDERNNLSLVLQSIEETHAWQVNPESVSEIKSAKENFKKDLLEKESKTWTEFNISELNSKVRSEIDALASQTEHINTELKTLRDQFNSSQVAYSEKVKELTAKLLFRTELLLLTREDLEFSVHNCECLKELLDNLKQEIAAKEDLLKTCESEKKELEIKCKLLKDKYYKKECELKEIHNSQLWDLKNQTKLTIDKLSEQIKNLNVALSNKDNDFKLQLSNAKQSCDKEILVLKELLENIILKSGKDLSNMVNKLNVLNFKIRSLSCEMKSVSSKLRDKDEQIFEQQSKMNSLIQQNEELQNHVESLSNLLEEANKALEEEKQERHMCENDVICWKEKFETTKQEVKNIYCAAEIDKEKLKFSLDETKSELNKANLKYSNICSKFEEAEARIQSLTTQSAEHVKLQQKCDSLIYEIECLNKSLNEEKQNCVLKDNILIEWKEKYESVISKIKEISLKVDSDMSKINMLLYEKNVHMKNTLSKFAELSTKFKNESNEILKLKQKLVVNSKELESAIVELKAEKESKIVTENAVSDWQSKYKSLECNLAEISSEKQKLEITLKELENIIADLKVEKENKMLAENAISEWQSKYKDLECSLAEISSEKQKLEITSKELENIKADLKVEKENRILAENAVSEWQSKYKDLESNLAKICSEKLELEITSKEMETIIANLNVEEKNRILAENAVSNWQSKCKDLEYRLAEISSETLTKLDQLKSELAIKESEQKGLEKKLSESTAEMEKLKIQCANFLELQEEKNKCLKNLQFAEKMLDEEKKIRAAVEENVIEWKSKYDTALSEVNKFSDLLEKAEESIKQLQFELEEKNSEVEKTAVLAEEFESMQLSYETQIKNLNDLTNKLKAEAKKLSILVDEKETIIKCIQKEQENLETHHEESLKCMKDKLENAEKNYRTQMEEMKLKFFQLEKEKSAVEDKNKELVSIQTKFSELKATENDLKSKLKSKEEELNVLQQRFETVNKEQVEKIHSFLESMKDKENMIVKLKTNLELITKENSEKIDDLNKRIKILEEEREQLMLQAQERVSNTEAKCREDIRALQEANNRLLSENKELEKLKVKIGLLNNQLDESLLVAEANQAAASKEIAELKEQLAMAQEKVCSIEKEKSSFETQLSENLQKLQTENKILLSKTDNVEQLKAEKEELNEKLKFVEKQVTYLKQLEEEKKCLKEEKESIIEELKLIKSVQEEVFTLQEKVNSFQLNENLLKTEIENLKANKEKLMSELSVIKDSLNSEKESFKYEKEKLLKRISLLENFDSSDSENAALKDYIAMIKGDYETALKAKETEMESKLKQLVKDFCVQMDIKDKDCDQMISEMIEKSQNLEERLQKEYRNEIAALKQDMFEKACALEEMRESYEEALHEKDVKIKELELALKNLSPNCGNASSGDWDDTWAVPEEIVENSSPVHDSKSCKEHLQQIESLQEELSKSNSEIKELKILLRLSPPESMVNNNNRRDSLQSIPEPTEFEYLKNIIYEYMMGKEPVVSAFILIT